MQTLTESVRLAPLAAVAAAAGLATFILLRPWAEGFHRLLAGVLYLTALVQAADWAFASPYGSPLLWRQIALSAQILRMAALYLLGRSLIQRSGGQTEAQRQRQAYVALLIASGTGIAAWWGAFTAVHVDAQEAAILGPSGRPVYAVLLVGLVLALAQLESVLRASREPFRYRVRFVLLGVGALCGFEIYVCAQTLLLGEWRSRHGDIGGVVALLSVALVAFGLGRIRLARTLDRVAVSPQMVYGSFTVLSVGLYLVGVGVLAEILQLSGQSERIVLAEIVVFALTVALVVTVSSRAARARFRVFVSRHFLRSRYDYRTKWLEVTDAFKTAGTVEEILDRSLDLLARTFGTPRLSIWMRYEADDRFHHVRSTNIEPPPSALPAGHWVVRALEATDAPTDLERLLAGSLSEGPDGFARVTQPVLGVPLQGDGELLGFFVFGAAPGGSYDDDDRDLLRAIAHHVAVLLTNTRLAEERQAAAELDALNRFSAFYVHDLKNLNARLSLVAQNAATHGNDPAFRETAMRTVARTSQEMGELIARLARRSPALGRLQPVDLGELVESVVASLGSDFHAEIVRPQAGVSPTLAVTQQLQQVLLNLFLNAKRASAAAAGEGEPPPVRVAIGEGAGRISIEIADRGCGIAPERLRTLFRPLRSDSPGGLGIGLYESKRIIESYRGSLRVESAPGRGTRVILELPAVAPEREVEHTAATDKELQS